MRTKGKTPTARRTLNLRKYAVARNTMKNCAPPKKQMAASGHPDRPSLDSLHVPPERAGHILDGDRWGGGHRHGTGRPGKTEFPAGWDDEKIIGHVLDVARAPDDAPVFQANRRWRVPSLDRFDRAAPPS